MRWLLLETPQPAEQLLHLVPVPTQRLERLQRMRPIQQKKLNQFNRNKILGIPVA